MKLQITPTKTLKDIQNQFHEHFPLLKIEFFKKPHRPEEPSAKKDVLDSALAISKLTKAKGEIRVTKDTKVSELEQQLQKDFGLFVQVFRKMGNTWVETSRTDEMTLEEQQESAKEAQTQYNFSMHNYADKRD
jgi:hypothetical protein